MDEQEQELNVVSNMLINAEREGLLVEVVISFGNECRFKETSIKQAAANAQSDWDI